MVKDNISSSLANRQVFAKYSNGIIIVAVRTNVLTTIHDSDQTTVNVMMNNPRFNLFARNNNLVNILNN